MNAFSSFHARGTMRAEILRLTVDAKVAAEQGRWDIVGACYACREERWPTAALSPQERDEIVRLDHEIVARIEVARSALLSAIGASSTIRNRLERLQRGSGDSASDSGSILLLA